MASPLKQKDCETCGNEIPEVALSCKFCGSQQRFHRRTEGPKVRFRVVNIEAGHPVVADAMAKLEAEIQRAKKDGVAVVRVIHGWGSSGTGGGRIREACRTLLSRKAQARQIRGVVAGDDYSRASNAGRGLMGRHPDLRSSERSDAKNPGITFVEL